MSGNPQGAWPPIITGADRPSWVVWRGVAVTTFMWGLFFVVLAKEVELAWRGLRLLAGRSEDPIDPGIAEFLAKIGPAIAVILVLVLVLGVSTLVSRRRREASLHHAPPIPVPDQDLARDLGLGEEELMDIRRRRIVALDVDDQLRVSVRPDWTPPRPS